MNHPSLTRRIAERRERREDIRQRFNQLPFAVKEEEDEDEENNPIVIFHLIGLGSGIGRVVSRRTIWVYGDNVA